MDVAIIATARFPIVEPFAGGMEMHTHVLADGLTKRGHDVTVYAAGGKGNFRVEAMLPLDFAASDKARRDIAGPPSAVLAEHHSYLDAVLRLAASSHDLVHVNAVHHLPFASSSLLPCAVTGTLHCPPTAYLESALTIAHRRPRPPQLVSVSATNAAAWGSHCIRAVIHNGVDLERWHAGPGGPSAVWTGRMVPEKAPHLAIDAARIAGVPLRLFGPAHDQEYFATEVAPRLGGDVEYAGHGCVDDVVDAVRHSCVAVVTPTWEEPFGLVVAEALACGTPVAGFARGALPELVDEETAVLSPRDDVQALADAILHARRLDRAACRRRAMERFSADVMVDAYDAWFTRVVAAS